MTGLSPNPRLWAGFLFHAWDGGPVGMHNLMDYRRRWQDARHVGDHLGRTAWALGAVIADEPVREEAAPCLGMLADMQPCWKAPPHRARRRTRSSG